MIIKQLLDDAIDNEMLDLQALIMFLSFEKQVIKMDDDIKKLDLFFLPKHKNRMNAELIDYKKKMSMKYKPYVFEVKGKLGTFYVYAKSEKQAMYIAVGNFIKVDNIKTCDLDKVMYFNNRKMTLRNIIKNKKPQILGGYK